MGTAKAVICLNHREEAKHQLARAVCQELAHRGIASELIDPSGGFIDRITRGHPDAVVLDYILGDLSTGLDVLMHLRKASPETQVHFLTDEPSISIATQALQLGAESYFDLNEPSSLAELCSSIEAHLTFRSGKNRPLPPAVQLDALVFQSPVMAALRNELDSALASPPTISVFFGNPGSGRRTVAQSFFVSQQLESTLIEVDGEFESEERVLEVLASSQRLGPFQVVLHNYEWESGKLLATVQRTMSSGTQYHGQLQLALCTASREVLHAWERALSPAVFVIPGLTSERKKDLPQLLQHFLRDLEPSVAKKMDGVGNDIHDWILKKEWPENLQQLQQVLAEALTVAVKLKSREPLDLLEERYRASLASIERRLQVPHYPRWRLAHALLVNNYHYSHAALSLGLAPSQLIATLRGEQA